MKRILLAAALALPPLAIAGAVVGQRAPAFEATDLAGKPVKLADYRGRTVVLEWNNFGCPFVQKHYRSGNMQALQRRYGAEVVWLAINSTAKDSGDYDGAIDDKRSTDVEDVKTARNHVAAALDEIGVGKPVTTAASTPYGCSIKYR